jgi:hypothetical protein
MFSLPSRLTYVEDATFVQNFHWSYHGLLSEEVRSFFYNNFTRHQPLILSKFVRAKLFTKTESIAVIDFKVTEVFPDNVTCSDFGFVPQQRNSVRTEGASVDAEGKMKQRSGRDLALREGI